MKPQAFFWLYSQLNSLICLILTKSNKLIEFKKANQKSLILLVVLAAIITKIITVNAALAIQSGRRGAQVIELQRRLQKIGYFDFKITGYYGSLTENAVREFQAANGLEIDGIAGNRTLAALGLSEAITTQASPSLTVLKLGSSGSKVIELQQYLQVLGYYNEPITGYYDLLTQRAVIRFQSDVRLIPDGIAGPLTQAAIESKFNAPSLSTSTSTGLSLPDRGNLR